MTGGGRGEQACGIRREIFVLHSRILLYLDTVARCGSIRKAGAQLNVASTAINRQILALEEELGTPLFQRLPRKLVLTAAGEILIAHVRDTLKGMVQARRLIDDMRGLHRGELVIAAMAGPTSAILPRALAELRRSHRNLLVHLRMCGHRELMEAVQQGEADLGIGFDLPRETGLRVLASRAVHLGAVVRRDHPLAGEGGISLADCGAWPLVVADASMAIRPHLDALHARLNLRLVPAMETNSIAFMRQMVLAEDAITFLTPFDIIEEASAGSLVFLPLRERSQWPQHLALLAHASNANPFLHLLVERITQILDSAPGRGPDRTLAAAPTVG